MVDEVEGTSQVKQAERENVRVYIYFIYFCVLFLFFGSTFAESINRYSPHLHSDTDTHTKVETDSAEPDTTRRRIRFT